MPTYEYKVPLLIILSTSIPALYTFGIRVVSLRLANANQKTTAHELEDQISRSKPLEEISCYALVVSVSARTDVNVSKS